MINYYQEKIKITSTLFQQQSKYNLFFDVFRGIVFLLILVFAYLALKNQGVFYWGLLGFFVILFLYVIKKSDQVARKLTYYQELKKGYENELENIVHHRNSYPNGEEFRDFNHPYTNDLDIFGESSLFHVLNRCRTYSGYSYFAKQLESLSENVGQIEQRQEAIRELQQNHNELIFHLLALQGTHKNSSTKGLIQTWLQQSNQFRLSILMKGLIYALPILNLVLLILGFLQPYLFGVLFVFLMLQWLILSRYNSAVNQMKYELGLVIDDIKQFDVYTDALKDVEFHSPLLQQIRREVMLFRKSTRQIYQILTSFDMGDSMIGAVGNLMFLTQIKTASKLNKWKDTYRATFPALIGAICEWETLSSLTIFYMNHPQFVFPKILENSSDTMIDACDLGHPLLDEKSRIGNDFSIRKNNFQVITGANMAGKSTYLRTVGINYVLACCGMPVCAESMVVYPAKLVTSLRTSDNLMNNESYFFAELKRLKMIIDLLQDGEELFIILDEILKGTNSVDKQKGSLALMKQFVNLKTCGIIATHDLLLGNLEAEFPEQIRNYRFEADIKGDELRFSYQLHDGVAKNMNACFLMQKMGITV